MLGHLGGITQHHLQLRAVSWQLEPQTARSHDLRVQFNRGGFHTQVLERKLGQRGSTQPQLHRV